MHNIIIYSQYFTESGCYDKDIMQQSNRIHHPSSDMDDVPDLINGINDITNLRHGPTQCGKKRLNRKVILIETNCLGEESRFNTHIE